VTSGNEIGESPASAAVAHRCRRTATTWPSHHHPGSGTVRYFNVYRSPAGGTAASAKFIGRVALAVGAADDDVRRPRQQEPGLRDGLPGPGRHHGHEGAVGVLRLKLAVTDLSTPEAHFRFCTLAVKQPRKNVLIDNLKGSF
jgi:hypothetical protein